MFRAVSRLIKSAIETDCFKIVVRIIKIKKIFFKRSFINLKKIYIQFPESFTQLFPYNHQIYLKNSNQMTTENVVKAFLLYSNILQ